MLRVTALKDSPNWFSIWMHTCMYMRLWLCLCVFEKLKVHAHGENSFFLQQRINVIINLIIFQFFSFFFWWQWLSGVYKVLEKTFVICVKTNKQTSPCCSDRKALKVRVKIVPDTTIIIEVVRNCKACNLIGRGHLAIHAQWCNDIEFLSSCLACLYISAHHWHKIKTLFSQSNYSDYYLTEL